MDTRPPHRIVPDLSQVPDEDAAHYVQLTENEANFLAGKGVAERAAWLRGRIGRAATKRDKDALRAGRTIPSMGEGPHVVAGVHDRLTTAETIAAAWREYDEHVLPSTAGEVQRTQTRMAFYAGCDWIIQRMMGASEGDEDEAVGLLGGFFRETQAFGREHGGA